MNRQTAQHLIFGSLIGTGAAVGADWALWGRRYRAGPGHGLLDSLPDDDQAARGAATGRLFRPAPAAVHLAT